MRYLVKRLFTVFVILLCSVTVLSAQNKNSVQGDYDALQALYNSTQGQSLPKLSSTSELPRISDADYPYMYMINGEIHYLDQDRDAEFTSWKNAGEPWPDKTGWDTMTPETMGDALGVETNADGRVISIDMFRITAINNFDGNPGYKGNNLAGELPIEINNLKKIKYFYIKQNFFHGEIPDISNWDSIEEIAFAGQDQYLKNGDSERSQWHEYNHWGGTGKKVVTTNRFRSRLPGGLEGKQNLRFIEFRHQFLLGPLPSWSNLPAIETIVIDYGKNAGSGSIAGHSIPESWENLTNTIFLKIDRNGLVGDFPTGIDQNWNNLSHISAGQNEFTGPVPEFLNSRDKRYIYLVANQFSGGFPSGYFNGDNSELIKWQIGSNNLSGELPQTVPSPSYPKNRSEYWVTAPGIGKNNFTGEIPEWIQTMDQMQTWYIVGNSFEGPFPKTVAEQDRLKMFYVTGNNLGGVLPDVSWGDRPNPWIYMGSNNFEGEIPDSWISMFAGNDSDMPFSSYSSFTGTGASLSWNSVTNAVAYELQVRDSNGNLVRNITSIPTDYIVSDLPPGEYRWRVRGLKWYSSLSRIYMNNNNLSGRIPDWPLNLDIERFYLSKNRFTFVDIGPVYDAMKAHMGDGFRVDDQKPFGREQNRTMPEGGEVIFDLSEYDYTNNSYQWLKDGTPINGENSPILSISNISSADEGSYVLEVTNSDLAELGTHQSQPIHFQIGVDDGGNSSDDGSKDSDNGDDQKGDEPATGHVFPEAPVQQLPLNSAENTSLTPKFSWSDIGADYYVLHSSRDNPGGMVIEVIVEDTTFTPTEILGANGTHHWRVHGVKDGEAGEWSPIWKFTTEDANIPQMAELISPEGRADSVDTNPWLEWTAVEADYYDVRLRESDSEEWLFTNETDNTVYSVPMQLKENTEYTWQVKTVLGGVDGAWGPMWKFSTGIYEVTVEAPSLIAPVHETEYSTLNPVFEWESTDADQYILEVLEEQPSNAKRLSSSTVDNIVIVCETTEPHCAADEALDPETTYIWRVKAMKDNVEGEWSETWEFKTPGDVTVNIDEEERPLESELSQNYPNPFNPSTQIEFTLSEEQNVSMKVYNMAGREVANLVNEVLNAGSHSVTFNAGHLSSGIYFYRYVTRNQSFTKKMTLVK